MADVVVVGAGIAGLTLARLLSENGATVQVLDKAAYPGGRLSSRTVAGRLVDTGPTGFQVTDPEVAGVLQRLAPDALSCQLSGGRWDFSYRSSARAVAAELATGLDYRKVLVNLSRTWVSTRTWFSRHLPRRCKRSVAQRHRARRLGCYHLRKAPGPARGV